jgi:hypothetical protein
LSSPAGRGAFYTLAFATNALALLHLQAIAFVPKLQPLKNAVIEESDLALVRERGFSGAYSLLHEKLGTKARLELASSWSSRTITIASLVVIAAFLWDDYQLSQAERARLEALLLKEMAAEFKKATGREPHEGSVAQKRFQALVQQMTLEQLRQAQSAGSLSADSATTAKDVGL